LSKIVNKFSYQKHIRIRIYEFMKRGTCIHWSFDKRKVLVEQVELNVYKIEL